MSKTRVFVYGTLRAGMSNHDLISRASPDDPLDQTISNLFELRTFSDSPAAIPFVTFSNKADKIKVESYLLTDSQLALVDNLEGFYGHPSRNFYERRQVKSDQGKEGYIYYLPENRKKDTHKVGHGDYVDYVLDAYLSV